MRHILYTFIAEECKQEAKKFGLVSALESIRQRIEKDQNLNKFELFEFPYLMRKKFSYQYRLLIKMVRREYQNKIYDIVVFLKIYHRGDKSYNSLYINSRPQFDAIYQQRDVEPALNEFVKNLSPQQDIQAQQSSDLLPLLTEYRVDSLNLSEIIHEFYYESTQWQYAIAPKLSPTQLKNHHQTLFYAIERTEKGELQFTQDTHYYPALNDLQAPKERFSPFIYPQKIAYNMQKAPYYLGVEHDISTRTETQQPVSQYQRKIPLELALDEQLWTLAQQHHLPFELNDFQQQCFKELCFNYSPYPFIINASSNTGKTTLLALLYVHFLFKQNLKQSLPCLFLCQNHEVESLHSQIKHYIQFYLAKQPELKLAYNAQQLDKLLQQSCLTSRDYLWSALNKQQQKEFALQNFIDEYRFCQLYQKQFNPEKNPDYDCAQLAWYVIQYIIKEQNIFDDNLSSVQHQPISEATFQFIYEKIWKVWYVNLAKQSFWDEQDLISYIDENEITLPYYSVLLADNSQRFSASFLDLLLNHNMWLKLGMTEHLHNIPLIFMENNEFCDGIYKWQPALLNAFKKLIMVNNFDYFEPEQTSTQYPLPDIAITHLNDHAFNLYGAIPSLFDTYHHQFSLSSRDLQKITTNDLGNPIEIVIVSADDEEFIPLLQQHHVPIIINNVYDSTEKVLREKSVFKKLCQLSAPSEVPLAYSYQYLPVKKDMVILAGFDLDVISKINQLRQETQQLKQQDPILAEKLGTYELANIHKLSEQQRYSLDGQLCVLTTALNQGLKRIYIMSDMSLETWQQFFDYPTIHVRAIQAQDVERFKAVHEINLPPEFRTFDDYLHILLQNQRLNDEQEFACLTHALYYQQQFDIEQRLKYEALYYFSTQKTDIFWKKYASYVPNYYLLHILWIMGSFKAFLSYKQYIPAHLKAHLTAIELYEQKDYSNQWLKQCQELLIDVVQNTKVSTHQHNLSEIINHEFWQKSWLTIQHHWFKQLSELQPYQSQQYQQLHQALAKWIEAGLIYDIDLWAFLTAHIGQYQTAIDIWQQAFNQGKIVQYPLEYHWAKLQLIEDTQQRLNYLFSIANRKLTIQELLAMNLNQLHESYWQQILEYLQDEQELLPVLEQLLPAIDSQEVLDRLINFCKLDPDNEMFTRRIQRLKTLHACLYSDWDTVLERLNLYLPIADESVLQQRLAKHFQNVAVVRNSKKARLSPQHQYQDEVLDIVYALNLSTHFGIAQSREQLEQYQHYELAQEIFSLIRRIFATPDPDPNSNHIIWKANFSAVRALTCLVEKSPDLNDPFFLYGQLVAETDSKENLYPFFLERLYVTMERIKLFQADDEKLMETVERMEQRLKKQLQNFNLNQLPIEPPILKQPSEIIKSILALTTQENAKIQQLEREERLAQERAEKERIEREQAILRERERVEQERLKAERLAQQQAEEQQRLEAERIAQQQAEEQQRLEAERIAQQQAEEQQRLEAERIAQQQAEQQRLEAERIAQQQAEEQRRLELERIAQQQAEQQRLQQEQMLTHTATLKPAESFVAETVNSVSNSTNYFTQQAPNLNAYVPQTSTIEFTQFDLRVFLARSHRRLNIENSKTGELFSINLTNGQVKSDWVYQQQQHIYHIPSIQLNVLVFNDSIHLHYLTYGVYSQIQL